ncbi:MAG: autoantigen p27 domain-containing protein [Candidatus Bathyarchaeota archaeon]|nr:autoantigen p27 domain-containing protein [Candidatus Bathyarchaeota archaeon]
MTDQSMKDMAEMLRQGAKMLSMSCPECGTPLFQLKTGEIFCPHEKREVKIIKEGESLEKAKQDATLEQTLQSKLQLLQQRLEAENDPAEIRELAKTITVLLDALNLLKPAKA